MSIARLQKGATLVAALVAAFLLVGGAAWGELPDDAAACLELVEVYAEDEELTGYNFVNRCDEQLVVDYCIPESVAPEGSELRCGATPGKTERGSLAYFSGGVPRLAPGESKPIMGDGCKAEGVFWCSHEDGMPIVDAGTEDAVILHWGACYGRGNTTAIIAFIKDQGRYTCKPRKL